MVLYLLPAGGRPLRRGRARRAAPAAGRSGASTRRSTGVRAVAVGLPGAAGLGAGPSRRDAWSSLLGFALGSLALAPWIGRDFFPTVDAGQFRLHVRAPSGHAHRGDRADLRPGRGRRSARSCPSDERDMILDNMGMSPSFTVRAYIDNGTVSNADGEILVSLKDEPSADGRLRRPAAAGAAASGSPTARSSSSRPTSPARSSTSACRRRSTCRWSASTARQPRRRQEAAARAGQDPRHRRRPPPPDHRRSPTCAWTWTASWPRELGLTQQNVAGSVLVSLSSTSQTAPELLGQPEEPRQLRLAVQTPPDRIDTVDAC